jgi:DNA-binding NtrC family response regulator
VWFPKPASSFVTGTAFASARHSLGSDLILQVETCSQCRENPREFEEKPMAKILVVDDEPSMVDVLCTVLRGQGHDVVPAATGDRAIQLFPQINPDLVITDIKMSPVNGMEVLRATKQYDPKVGVIMITAYATVESAVEAMRMGAYHYITKPFKIDELQMTVERALKFEQALDENRYLKKLLKPKYRFDNIVGSGPKMQEVFRLMEKVAPTDSTVLILGESGTGKELVARALHFNSRRQDKKFVPINCSALPEQLLESELFGHRKGSFTGATTDKKGLFQEADGGTIFLDEIGWMAASLQTKLLRVLQERELRRVGDTLSEKVDVRVLAATNQPLQQRIKEGSFREDLFYRISVIPVELPPLRERVDDIPELVHHFLAHRQSPSSEAPKIDDDAMEVLMNHTWPGNVRELENAIERAVALCDNGRIQTKDLPPRVLEAVETTERKYKFVPKVHQEPPAEPHGNGAVEAAAGAPPGETAEIPAAPAPPRSAPAQGSCSEEPARALNDFIQEQEQRYIRSVLERVGGDKKEAAKLLQVSIATLYRKLGEQPAAS